MNILRAIRWVLNAWKMEISSSTCYSGFLKSNVLEPNQRKNSKDVLVVAQEENHQFTALVEANTISTVISGLI